MAAGRRADRRRGARRAGRRSAPRPSGGRVRPGRRGARGPRLRRQPPPRHRARGRLRAGRHRPRRSPAPPYPRPAAVAGDNGRDRGVGGHRGTVALTAACAPLVTRTSPVSVLNVVRRDGGRHPSPNAGRCEAAFAAALGVRLGGTNVYGGLTETRPDLGDGRVPEPEDIRRAVLLSRAVTVSATALAVLIAVFTGA